MMDPDRKEEGPCLTCVRRIGFCDGVEDVESEHGKGLAMNGADIRAGRAQPLMRSGS